MLDSATDSATESLGAAEDARSLLLLRIGAVLGVVARLARFPVPVLLLVDGVRAGVFLLAAPARDALLGGIYTAGTRSSKECPNM